LHIPEDKLWYGEKEERSNSLSSSSMADPEGKVENSAYFNEKGQVGTPGGGTPNYKGKKSPSRILEII